MINVLKYFFEVVYIEVSGFKIGILLYENSKIVFFFLFVLKKRKIIEKLFDCDLRFLLVLSSGRFFFVIEL